MTEKLDWFDKNEKIDINLFVHNDSEDKTNIAIKALSILITTLGEQIMSAISDFAAREQTYNTSIDASLEGLKGDVANLNAQIAALQASSGVITPADQALLDGIDAKAKAVQDKLASLDALTPSVVNPPPPPSPGGPNAPTGVSAVGEQGQITVSFTGDVATDSYNLYSSDTAGITTATGTKTTGVVSPSVQAGLTDNTTQFYVVTAQNANGESLVSAEVSATTLGPVAPTSGELNQRAAEARARGLTGR